MAEYTYIKMNERPELMHEAARWYSSKWRVPEEAYLESIRKSLQTGVKVPAWYLCLDGEKIIGGLGVIANDFHDRKDLTPNVCAVYTEKEYRCQGIAGTLLNKVCDDFSVYGIETLYLLTDHDSFYERYGWEYLCSVTGEGEETPSRMYIHQTGKPVTETGRLFLRELKPSDRGALYAVLGDSDIMRHYPYSFDEERVQCWIEKNLERYRELGFGLWAVCRKDTGEMIGDCGLTMQSINGKLCPEIGYHIRKDQQKKGYAKEAAAAVRDWTFAHTPFHVVYSYMKSSNLASRATAESYGAVRLGEFTDAEGESSTVYRLVKEIGAAASGR